MKRALLVMALIVSIYSARSEADEQVIEFRSFGQVTLYSGTPNPSHIMILVSGDGGWNKGAINMARNLATLDSLVVGVNVVHYLKALAVNSEKCSYPAGDFEALSKFVQKKLNFPEYVTPLLVGYSSGATLVYATLVQSPPGTFLGGVSLGFCPDLKLRKPLCKGYGLEWNYRSKMSTYIFSPAPAMKSKFVVFQGVTDEVCDPKDTTEFVGKIPNARIVVLPKVGHGYAGFKNWLPQFMDTYSQFTKATPDKHSDQKTTTQELKDLPLIEVRSKTTNNPLFALVVTGDGGWANIDRQLGENLADGGMDVVGLNSLQYFWKKRTPDDAGKDLDRILNHYFNTWGKKEVILIGYSLGADVLPFMTSRLPAQTQARIKLVVLLGPSNLVDFEFHLTDWLGGFSHNTSMPVLPEVDKLKDKKVLCVYAGDDKNSICRKMGSNAKAIPMGEGHHFDGNYSAIAESILKAVQ